MMRPRSRHLRLWVLGFTLAAVPLVVLAAELNPPAPSPPAPSAPQPQGHLGIMLADFDVNAGAAFASHQFRGAIVTAVTVGDVADRAGMRRGDVVTRFGDQEISGARALAMAVGHTAPGSTVTLVIRRGAETLQLKVDLSTAWPAAPQPAGQFVDGTDWDSLRDANMAASQPQLRDELLRMSGLDEFRNSAPRMDIAPDTSIIVPGPRVQSGSSANVRRMRQIIQQYGWPRISMVGIRGANAAGLIALSARDDTPFQAQVLALMEPLLQRDEVPAMYYASLYDIVHTPQRFGQEQTCVAGENQPSKPIEDPQHLEERRAALGLIRMPKHCIDQTGNAGTH